MYGVSNMKTSQIAKAVNGEWLVNCEEKEICVAFASDLMSDVLALVTVDSEETILVTGLVNPQTLRTAEMLDISLVILVRNKILTEDLIDQAQDHGIQLMTTKFSMF